MPAGSDVTVTPLSLDYALRGSSPFTWTTTFTALGNLKLGGGNATAEDFAAQRPGARQGFGSLRLAATAEGSFAEGWQLRSRPSQDPGFVPPQVANDGQRLRADLDVVPDDDDPHAILAIVDEASDERLREGRVRPNVKLTAATAQRFLRTGEA